MDSYMAKSASKCLYIFNGSFDENKYNQFFNPNLCHVCKSPNLGRLIPCKKCNMIFYCCKQHKKMHLKSHRSICESIVRTIAPDWQWDTSLHSLESWIKVQTTFAEIIQKDLERDLEAGEIEMFMCAKSCLICYRRNNLQTCNICYSANYCDDHKSDFIIQHEPFCNNLLILLNMNISSIMNICYLYPIEKKFTQFPSHRPFDDMFSFVQEYVAYSYLSRFPEEGISRWRMKDFVCSDFVSGPLTLYYALKGPDSLHILQNGGKFIVHIIAASVVDIEGLPAWEILLHLFRNIKKLYVIMIKPEVDCESNKYQQICTKCTYDYSQKFYVNNVSVSYDEYLNMDSYMRPNVIIGFQAEFNIKATWSEFLPAMLATSCPLLLTATSEEKAEENMNKIEGLTSTTREFLFSTENKFRGYRPHRDYETGGIWYRNAYLIMYS